MRTHLLALLLLASAALTPSARADTYQFTFQGNFQPTFYDPLGAGPTLTLAWQLSGPPVFFLYDGQNPGYEYPSVPLSGNAINSDFNLTLFSYSSIEQGDPEQDVIFYTMDGSLYDVYGIAGLAVFQSFYTGPESNPVFLPGSYPAEFTYRDYSIYDGTLSVVDRSTLTPEPSTFALLGTGLVGMVRVLRRRPRHGPLQA